MKKDLEEMKRNDEEMEETRETRQRVRKRERGEGKESDNIMVCRSPTPELLSADMRLERERMKWERDAYRETADEEEVNTGPTHYQNIQHNGEEETHTIH